MADAAAAAQAAVAAGAIAMGLVALWACYLLQIHLETDT